MLGLAKPKSGWFARKVMGISTDHGGGSGERECAEDAAAAVASRCDGEDEAVRDPPTWCSPPSPQTPESPAFARAARNDRMTVIGARRENDGGYAPPVVAKSAASTAAILGALAHSVVFEALTAAQRASVADAMDETRFAAGEAVLEQGDRADAFFVIESGAFGVTVEGKGRVATLGAGGSFGELGLIMNQPRAATIDALEDCVAWRMDSKCFHHFLA